MELLTAAIESIWPHERPVATIYRPRSHRIVCKSWRHPKRCQIFHFEIIGFSSFGDWRLIRIKLLQICKSSFDFFWKKIYRPEVSRRGARHKSSAAWRRMRRHFAVAIGLWRSNLCQRLNARSEKYCATHRAILHSKKSARINKGQVPVAQKRNNSKFELFFLSSLF